ncbi:YsnF/AvaK domain-containing protein [Mastigocoleus sp. MO_188.B34]|uniref:YsnF/AvaK domain-containing protein n=1 Tax=Mastigocoleus sp. MO_188.B34 TaxID=3036635 RepID=UPI00261E6FCD|nr:YsnF/AvaK domain-containing protein [Mastigocoleus sp. MO_188.B34]MDJ0694181.1 YsnF/AvaK domain-containing protein [Mastigocoleus sp. MO_188.B34]
MTTAYNSEYKRAVGLFYSREEAEKAVRKLKDAGFDMNRVSVVARDADEIVGTETTQEIGNKADDGAAAGALTGGALGGIAGLLVGLGTLAIPGVGPILLAGAEATAIATTLAGGAIGAAAGGLVGTLIGLGIPEEKAKIYGDRVASGSFLVMVTGTAKEVIRAETYMQECGVEEFGIYNTPSQGSSSPEAVTPVASSEYTGVQETENIKLYEERLVADKERAKAGELSVGKRVETETASVSVPVEKERIVVERSNPTNLGQVSPGATDFSGGKVARMEVYEESADIQKQAFVREEVKVRKEVEHDTVEAKEKLRREELEVDVDGNPVVKKQG